MISHSDRDNKIERVGKGLAIPADAKVIDLSQMTVLPGLIDCHTHLADGPTDDGDPFSQLKKTAAQVAFESVPNARTFLREGFTTVRDVGVYRALMMSLCVTRLLMVLSRAAHVCGWRLRDHHRRRRRHDRTRARHHDALGLALRTGRRPVGSPAEDSPVGARRCGPYQGPLQRSRPDPWQQSEVAEFTPEELQAAVDEANHFGLRVAAHAHSPEGIKNAIRAGVASIEHATMIDDEGIALAKQHGTYLDMDIYDESASGSGPARKNSQDFLQHDAELGELHRRNFRKAVSAE